MQTRIHTLVLLDCPCGGSPVLAEAIGSLNGAEWKQYQCSNKYKTNCRIIRAGASRDLKTAKRKWNKAVKVIQNT